MSELTRVPVELVTPEPYTNEDAQVKRCNGTLYPAGHNDSNGAVSDGKTIVLTFEVKEGEQEKLLLFLQGVFQEYKGGAYKVVLPNTIVLTSTVSTVTTYEVLCGGVLTGAESPGYAENSLANSTLYVETRLPQDNEGKDGDFWIYENETTD